MTKGFFFFIPMVVRGKSKRGRYAPPHLKRKGDYMLDQTAKADAGKIRPTLVPTQLIKDVAEVREYGNRKYGSSDNWKQVEVQRYRDALCRHLLAYIDDPKSVDEESGIPHYKHMACNCAFICAMEAEEPEQIVVIPHKEFKRMAKGGLIAKEIEMRNLTFKDKICRFFAKFKF